MDDFTYWGEPSKKKKKKLSFDSLDIGLKPFKNDLLSLDTAKISSDKPKRDSRRTFTKSQQKEILAQQNNKCARCKEMLDMRVVEFDHKKPWAAGGKTVTKNGRALCRNCHGKATNKATSKKVDKTRKPKKRGIFDL